MQDHFRPFRDSDLVVARRWYPAAPGAPCLPFPSAFCSPHWEPFPWLPRNVGAVYPDPVTYPRLGVIQGFDYEHVCGSPDDFARGAVFDPARNVVYDDEWIPECCGRDSVCVTQLCSQEQEFGRPAAQLRSYPIPHQDATDTTPVVVQHWGLNLGNNAPAWPGFGFDWWPGGEAGAVALQHQVVADNAGNLQFEFGRWAFPGGAALQEHRDAGGYTIDVTDGVSAGTLTLGIVDGVLTLCGANATICAELMPSGVVPRFCAGALATGTTQGTATLIPQVFTQVASLVTGRGVRLPPVAALLPNGLRTAQVRAVIHVNSSPATSIKVYPATGEAFPGLGVDNPLSIARGAGVLLLENVGAQGEWAVIPYPPTAAGTVTAVGISSTSSGVSVGVTNPNTTPSLTVDVDGAIQDVVAVASYDALVAGTGGGGLISVTIGPRMSYAAGVLDAVPAGSDAEVQLNQAGAFGSTSNLKWNGATNTLEVVGALDVNADIHADNVKVTQHFYPNTMTATTLGSVIGFFEVRSNNGGPTGYIPIYDSIT